MPKDIEKTLNKREQYKARLCPYDYFAEFDTIDFESLSEGDRYYLQDFGIFNIDFLEDEFTIRLRNAGGRISHEHFSHIASIAKEYELTLVITARGGFQLHDVEAEDVREIWYKLNQNGLTTWQSFGDNIRNIVTDVYDGVNKYAKLEVYSLINQMQDYILKNPKYVGMLPRRISIGISGNEANVNSFFANDIYFALAKKGDRYGFNVYMGGKNKEIAKDTNIFLNYEDVFPFFKAFVHTFYTHGSRFSRSKTRLFYMIEEMGIDALNILLQQEFSKSFEEAGELQLKHVDFLEYEELSDGTFAYTYQTDFGRLRADEMQEIAHFAKTNNASLRIGIDQNIYILGLATKETAIKSTVKSSTVVACAGKLCPYAVWSIKDETSFLPLDLIYENRIKVGFSGCAKGCARHRHTDIGLIGLKTNNFGDTEGGARIFIGAEHDNGQSVARELFSMVPFVHLKEVVTLIIELYELSEYQNFQLYAHHVLNKYSESFLALWHLYNLKNRMRIPLQTQTFMQTPQKEKELLEEHFHNIVFVEDNFKKSVSVLVKELWTVAGKDHHYTPPIKRVKFR